MIKIKDIAKEANVSEGTVDRVIHNRSGVSKKTEAKVRKILERHSFKVNPVASALAMKKKHQISVLIPEHNDSDLFWKSPYLGVLKAAEDVTNLGVYVNIFRFNQSDSISYLNAFKDLLETKPTAVIMVPNFSDETKQIIKELEVLNIPYLFLNINLKGFNNIAYVGQDSYTAGYVAGKLMDLNSLESSEFLIIQSSKKISRNNAIFNRVKGFKNYFLKNEINSNPQTLKLENLNNTLETQKTINSHLKNHPEIKGVFVPSSRIYMVVNCMEEHYLKKLQLIGFDNTPQNTECLINDSVAYLISQKPFDQGYKSVRLLVDYLVQGEIPEQNIYLPIDILIKENVRYNGRDEFISKNTTMI